ncbi:MAG: SpoIIE family protein phosphatase [Acidobacteriia bacterium]|nr:SpoIIE family protein phosphatase [Terriglobia bacterium]
MNIKEAWSKAEERRQYWQTIPLSAVAWLGLTAFLSFSSIGLGIDLGDALQRPLAWALAGTVLIGILIALSMATILRVPKARFIIAPLLVLVTGVLPRITTGFPLDKTLMGPGFEHIRWRLAIDGILSILAASAGWASLVIFAGTQGVKHVRLRTELELAERLQQTLAPPLVVSNPGYEIHGRSAPSSQMGGDLLDAVDDPAAGMTVYAADVAGHGIQAGVFMGMVKSSVRMALLKVGPLAGLLCDLNRVVFEVKTTPATYVTFACLQCRESGKIDYSLAGSGPILHYSAQIKTTTQLAMEQFLLGLFGNATFQSHTVEIQPGDILALLADGLPEATNAGDEQFGLDRMGEIIARRPGAPLSEITESIFTAVRGHGLQTDDETLVLVRRR